MRHPRHKLLLTVALAAVTLALLPSTASAAAPRGFVGLQGWAPPTVRDWSRLDRANVRLWRVFLYWSSFDPAAQDPYNLARYDRLFARAATAGVRILPVVIRNPALKQPRTRRGRRAFHAFAAAIADRYGPRGQFWRERPTLKPLGANRIQIWNEPNHPHYWKRPNVRYWERPAAREYAVFLIGAARAIRAANPRVKIVTAGILNNRRETYLKEFYRVRGARAAFDVMAIHSFTRSSNRVLAAVDRVRRVMRQHGDSRKPMMLTEVGVATGYGGQLTTSERGQASFVRSLYGTLLHYRRSRRLLGAVWFSYRDRRLRAGEANWWATRTGLFRKSGRAKPSWYALLKVTGGSR